MIQHSFKLINFLFVLCLVTMKTVAMAAFPSGSHEVVIPNVNGVRSENLLNIAPIVEKSIVLGFYPGAVIIAAHKGQIIYQGVFGNRRIVPSVAPMQLNTIFDIASLTKVVATTPAIMQLVEQGKIDLDKPVADYWRAFGERGKDTITIRQLMTHTSGLTTDLPLGDKGKENFLHQIEKSKLVDKPGSKFVYNDINFVVLAHLVELVTQTSFDQYVNNNIFKPLGMNNTSFLPNSNLQDNIAPTEVVDQKLKWGTVHDPIAHEMGGISGNAGVFSTGIDLARYAQCLLNNGRIDQHHYLLGPLTVLKMITPQTGTDILEKRGLGWDIDSHYSNRGILFPVQSFGHTGWTGTGLWIDPMTQTYIIILTSRVHPYPAANNQLIEDRKLIANVIAGSITDISINGLNSTHQKERK